MLISLLDSIITDKAVNQVCELFNERGQTTFVKSVSIVISYLEVAHSKILSANGYLTKFDLWPPNRLAVVVLFRSNECLLKLIWEMEMTKGQVEDPRFACAIRELSEMK